MVRGACPRCGSAWHECECPTEAERKEYERQKLAALRARRRRKRNPTYSLPVESKYRGGPTSIDIEFVRMSAMDTIRSWPRHEIGRVIYFTFRYRAASERGIESQGYWEVEEWDEAVKKGLEYFFWSIAEQLSRKVWAISGMSMEYAIVLRKKLEQYLDRLSMEDDKFAMDLNSILEYRRNPRRYRRNREALNLDYGREMSSSREGRMLRRQLLSMQREAGRLHSLLEDGDDLPGWVQGKVATSLDRLHSARQYIESKLESMGYVKNPMYGDE